MIAASAYAAGRLAEGCAIPREKIRVIPEPFDFDRWAARLPSIEREPIVLAVGHAYPRKNLTTLLRAWPEVARQRPDARLVVVGHGPEQEKLGHSVMLLDVFVETLDEEGGMAGGRRSASLAEMNHFELRREVGGPTQAARAHHPVGLFPVEEEPLVEWADFVDRGTPDEKEGAGHGLHLAK